MLISWLDKRKDDLAQMNRGYFQSLSKERLVEVANNLHQLAVEQWEKINSNSRNSSQPPSSDNPFQKPSSSLTSTPDSVQDQSNSNWSPNKSISPGKQTRESTPRRKPGRQKRFKGIWS